MLLFNTNGRWLSKGNVIKQEFKLRDELKLFFEEHKKIEFFDWLNDVNWIAHWVDIFDQLNKLNARKKYKYN